MQDIYDRLARIENKIDTLMEFKITSIVTARYVSLLVSGICGLLTMIVTTLLHYYFLKE
jgi:hypothetical protein